MYGYVYETTYSEENKDNVAQWKNKLSQSIKGRRWVTKNGENKQVKPEDLEKLLNDGWVFGRTSRK